MSEIRVSVKTNSKPPSLHHGDSKVYLFSCSLQKVCALTLCLQFLFLNKLIPKSCPFIMALDQQFTPKKKEKKKKEEERKAMAQDNFDSVD